MWENISPTALEIGVPATKSKWPNKLSNVPQRRCDKSLARAQNSHNPQRQPMSATSASLLVRLRDTADAPAWHRFVGLYAPLFRHWAARAGLGPHDSDDLAQEVFVVLARRLPDFRYEPANGRFRGWLRIIVTNCLRNFLRTRRATPTAPGGTDFLEELSHLENDCSELSRAWDAALDYHVLLGVLAEIEPEFEPATVAAFRRTVLNGDPTGVVATSLGLTPNAVLLAKSRILRRLREELAELVD
ncbi:MAG: RNA polymerase subunit sigma-24 [Planctomycetaceae bacterium]|nr:RNA polymerase subunit sigma-24 [Planctomycetaceae bacterium]